MEIIRNIGDNALIILFAIFTFVLAYSAITGRAINVGNIKLTDVRFNVIQRAGAGIGALGLFALLLLAARSNAEQAPVVIPSQSPQPLTETMATATPPTGTAINTPEPTPSHVGTPHPPGGECPDGQFHGSYYNEIPDDFLKVEATDVDCEEVSPERAEKLNYNWGEGSPKKGRIPIDEFAARFVGIFEFAEAGIYQFEVQADDGVRLWINNIPLVDAWIDQPITPYQQRCDIPKGKHIIRLEYYERWDRAELTLSWFLVKPDEDVSEISCLTGN